MFYFCCPFEDWPERFKFAHGSKRFFENSCGEFDFERGYSLISKLLQLKETWPV